MRDLIGITDMDKKKMCCVIAWCICSIFRGAFIDFADFYPFLLLTGPTQTAKSAILKVFAVDFYGVFNGFLSLSTISKNSRFEDFLSIGTFPLIINEAVGIEKIEGSGELKTMCTETSDYTRKLNARYSIKRPKVAPFGFTANYVDPFFLDKATMDRTLHIVYNKDDTIEKNLDWVIMRNKLKKYSLFSLYYDWYIKENEKIEDNLIDVLIKENSKKFFEYGEHKKYSKFMEIVGVIETGITIFNGIFKIDGEKKFLLIYECQ